MIDEQIRAAFQEMVDETPPTPAFPAIETSPVSRRWSPLLAAAVAAAAVLALFVVPSLLNPTEPNDVGTLPPPVTTTAAPVTTIAPGVLMPDVVGMTLDEAVRVLGEFGIRPFVDNEALGDDVIVEGQTPSAGAVWSGEDVLLSTRRLPGACQDYEWEPPTPADQAAVWFPCDAFDTDQLNFRPIGRPLEPFHRRDRGNSGLAASRANRLREVAWLQLLLRARHR